MIFPQMTFDLTQAYEVLGPLALIIGGIAVYGVFVFNFYRFLARKDIFTLNLQKHNQARRPALRKTITVIFYMFKYLMLYPIFVFFWFAVMATLLYLLGRNQPIDNVMLVAMGVVGAIRVCSYYKEALATDISKILPFALLGIMLIDSSIVRIINSTEGVREAALQWETVIYYLVAVVTLEFVLRMATGIFSFFWNRRKGRNLQEETSEPQTEPILPQYEVQSPVVSEPRPVEHTPATSPAVSRIPVTSAVPHFLEREGGPRTSGVESPSFRESPQGGDMPEWARSRPVYGSSSVAADSVTRAPSNYGERSIPWEEQ